MKMIKIMRILSAFIFSLFIMLSSSFRVYAIESKITYEGKAEEFIILDEDIDLFDNFKDVMPGDKLTQQIKIINNTPKGNNVELFLRAESPAKEDKGFINQLKLTVIENGKVILPAKEPRNQSGLDENVLFASFIAPGETLLEVILEVPLEMSNEFKNSTGAINWVFSATQTPVKQVETPMEEQPDPNNFPKTGSSTNTLYIVVGLLFILVGKTLYGERKNHHSGPKKTRD